MRMKKDTLLSPRIAENIVINDEAIEIVDYTPTINL